MRWRILVVVLLSAAWGAVGVAQDQSECLTCHEEQSLTSARGKRVAVSGGSLKASVHSELACTDCHDQPGKYDELPHFNSYRPVNCGQCHAEAAASYQGSFHDLARKRGVDAPGCTGCHQRGGDPHRIPKIDRRTSEAVCRRCHSLEADRYDTSVHAKADGAGKKGPGCTRCHPTHGKAFPPSAGAVDALCEQCHRGAMAGLAGGVHKKLMKTAEAAPLSCASCHDVHATDRARPAAGADRACEACHPGAAGQFEGSVHQPLLAKGALSCLSCHRTHQLVEGPVAENLGCGACHGEQEQAYRKSVHRLARLKGNQTAASCADCHGGHHIRPAADPRSSVNPRQIPNTCGRCHSEKQVFTSDYVRLPVSLPGYSRSVHGEGWANGKATAVCTDCHGVHDMESAASNSSSIHKENLARTCGRCHTRESKEYVSSVHGRAVAHGIKDSPTCTDCHDEHFILAARDPRSPVHRSGSGNQSCAKCHENPVMAVRYGLSTEVIKSFNDSYHGWAVSRGGKAVAVCVDCHQSHAIGSSRDPSSSIHKDQVVATCGKCHSGATATFAESYTHVLARGRRMAHDWVRLFYLWLIALVLGGMVLHNAVLYGHDLRVHYRKTLGEQSVQRMLRVDLVQHLVLMVSFGGLAISGFALRFPDAWWVQILGTLGLSEEVRRVVHRLFAVVLVLASLFHLVEIVLLERGREFFRDMRPKWSDLRDAIANVLHHAGRKGYDEPQFDRFDYTQKAEYWALLWGTLVMSATGIILWFPAMVTRLLPAWMVRVAETIHYYEAILAVAAIIVWHLFFVIARPGVYPMNWTWVTGRMPVREWLAHHGRAAKRVASSQPRQPPPQTPPSSPPDPE